MLRVLACVTQDHNWALLLLSVVLGLMTCAAAFMMLKRSLNRIASPIAQVWALAAGFSAGTGVWATHFVAMTAYDPGMPTSFALSPLLSSFAISALLQTALFWFAARQASRPQRSLWAHITPAVIGGLSGLSIALMHFVGMKGLLASAIFLWDQSLTTTAIALSAILSATALWLFFKPNPGPRAHLFSGLIFLLAICTLHFTSMGAISLILTPIDPEVAQGLPRVLIGILVGFGAVLVLLMGIAVAIADAFFDTRRSQENERLKAEVEAQTDKLIELAQEQSILRERAEAANAAKSTFLLTMSHELRTPLNAILGYSALIQEDAEEANQHEIQHDAARITNAGRHLMAIIEDILELSKLESGSARLSPTTFDIRTAVLECATRAERSASAKGITLSVELEDNINQAFNDEAKLKKCLDNLLSNAVKFTPAGGVRLRVSKGHQEGFDVIRFTCIDTGIGMTAAQQAHLFKPFSQIDGSMTRSQEGTGLGLVIARRFARIMQGDISVQSKMNLGSRFTLSIAANLDAEAPIQAEETSTEIPNIEFFNVAAA